MLSSMVKDNEMLHDIKWRKIQNFGHKKYRLFQLFLQGKIEGKKKDLD